MSVVGGDPGVVSSGAGELTSVGTTVGQAATAVNSAGRSAAGGAGDTPLGAALERFAAAFSQNLTDLETEIRAAATLAGNGAADLATAGGTGHAR